MRKFLTFSQISSACCVSSAGVRDFDCRGVCIDSRQIRNGDCFFAIKGERFDGHNYVKEAFDNGACCAVVSEDFDETVVGQKSLIRVPDTSQALGKLAAYYRSRLEARVVAITGSVGKTTSRDMISHILSTRFRCHSAKKSYNNHIGLPLSILEADSDSEVLILELGTNHPGEIEYLTKIARPDIALITKVAAVHIANFGSIGEIAKEKASIGRGLGKDGKLLVNENSEELSACLKQNGIDYIPFSLRDNYRLYDGAGEVFIDGETIRIPLPGKGNMENAIAAYYVCRQLGLTVEQFREGADSLKPSALRMNIVKTNGITVINDCYNASPLSMENAFEVLAGFKRKAGRLVAVCGDMLELGAGSDKYHRELGCLAANSGVDLLIAVGDFCGHIIEGAKKQAQSRRERVEIEAISFKQRKELDIRINDLIFTGDAVLFKGSRDIGLENTVKALTIAREKK